METQRINIIGRGNVGWHLTEAFKNLLHVTVVNPRNPALEIDTNADLTIIAVSDDAIESVVKSLPPLKGIIVHTAGSVGLDILASRSEKIGVFYPLQTFTKGKPINYSDIPYLLEVADDAYFEELYQFAALIGKDIRQVSSKQRKALHIAAVFACNFTNHMYVLADELLNRNSLDISLIKPLIKETFSKLEVLSPSQAQTGPAVRGDQRIMNSHLEALNDDRELAEIYRLLSNSIQKIHQ